MKKCIIGFLMIITNSSYSQVIDSTQLNTFLYNFHLNGTILEFSQDSTSICGTYYNDTVSIWSNFYFESNNAVEPEVDYSFPQLGDTTDGDFNFCSNISKMLLNAIYKRLNVTLDTIIYSHVDSSIYAFFPTDSLTPEQLTIIDTSRTSALTKYYYTDTLEINKLIICYQYSSFNDGSNVIVLGDGKLSDELILELYMNAIIQKFELQWNF